MYLEQVQKISLKIRHTYVYIHNHNHTNMQSLITVHMTGEKRNIVTHREKQNMDIEEYYMNSDLNLRSFFSN